MSSSAGWHQSPDGRIKIYDDPGALREAFEELPGLQVDLPPGESAYWTVPRQEGEWRLPLHSATDIVVRSRNVKTDKIIPIPVRPEPYYSFQSSFELNTGDGELLSDAKQVDGRSFELLADRNNSHVIWREVGDPDCAYLNVIPQPIISHRNVSKFLEDQTRNILPYYEHENTLARQFGVPMLLMRWDLPIRQDGTVRPAELDCVCSLWSLSSEYNPVVESHIAALETQIGCPILPVELYEPSFRKKIAMYPQMTNEYGEHFEVTPAHGIMQVSYRPYHHSDHHWGGWIDQDTGNVRNIDEVALIIRARRGAHGFKEFMDALAHRSITMAHNRDKRAPLTAAGLAVSAANVDVALAMSEAYQRDYPRERVAIKADGKGTELVAIHRAGEHAKGRQRSGEYGSGQVRRKFARNDYDGSPVALQPFLESDTLEEAGIQFRNEDHDLIRLERGARADAGERVRPGRERDYLMNMRTFMLYLPLEDRIVNIGGLWHGTPGLIVHGTQDSVAGPLYADGLMGHPDGDRSTPLRDAEAMLRKYGRIAINT